jgi:tetrapyrrole methylase family protein/MazG family protein
MVDFQCKERYDLSDYIALMAFLRTERGCSWDRAQTHESIKRNLLEEAYETYEAIEEGDSAHLREELGDLLMQVLFHAQMEAEAGSFDINDVANEACQKLVHRHPHVFASAKADTPDKVLDTWESVKRSDREQTTVASAMDGIPKALPSLWRAEKIQHKAGKVGFDWPDVSGAMDKLREEVDELQQGVNADDLPNIQEELGDVLFSAVNVARFYKLDPEAAMQKACEKFIRRFRYLEAGAAAMGRTLPELSLREMEDIYQMARHELEGKEIVPYKE